MFSLNLIPWAIAGFLALGVGVYVAHCEKVKSHQANFIASLEAQAQEQERRNQDSAKKYKQAQEQADETAKRNLDSLHATVRRLRADASRSASSLPKPPADSRRADLACFDRVELDKAIGEYRLGVLEITGKGAAYAVELDAARGWAKEITSQ